jgi:hypothetical protein
MVLPLMIDSKKTTKSVTISLPPAALIMEFVERAFYLLLAPKCAGIHLSSIKPEIIFAASTRNV